MKSTRNIITTATRLFLGSIILISMTPVFSQVSPKEILNPRAKADEQKYLPQLQSLQQAIAASKFPFPFRLARYLNAKPGERAASDSNGIEFVYFQHRVVLKISGLYRAAFDSTKLSENERASRTLQDTVAPILQLVARQIPSSADCDGIGFEIVYDTRDAGRAYDYEGKEVLTLVLTRDDAFTYANSATDAERQEILNRADVFVNGNDFGLALGQRDPIDVQALDREAPRLAVERPASNPVAPAHTVYVSANVASSAHSVASAMPASGSYPTFADAMRLQKQYQAQTDAIVKQGAAKFHLDQGAGPLFEVSGDQILLHVTMRNTLSFERTATSIYKRAAQSFDIFLAPELRELSTNLPIDDELEAIDFTVLNHFGLERAAPESIDYICPLKSVRSFAANKITTQELIDQSTVLVGGVRIGLNLQLVE